MTNLLKETEECLRKWQYNTFDDVQSIQLKGRRISIKRFKELADIDYDSGYGFQLVESGLVILLKDGTWMERAEYDGSEWWRHVVRPRLIEKISDGDVKSLFIDDFEHFNGHGNKDEDNEDDIPYDDETPIAAALLGLRDDN